MASLQVRYANLEKICEHFTYRKPASQAKGITLKVQHALELLVSSERVINKNGIFYPSFKQAGKYKVDLSGEVNIIRHPMLKALQQHPGIADADLDERFVMTHQPAWYETRAFPKD